jgi:Tfp pilus assembly protein PilO
MRTSKLTGANVHAIDPETRRFGRLLHYAGILLTVVTAAIGYSSVHAPTVRDIAETSAKIEDLLLSVRNAPAMREQHRIESEKLSKVTNRIANLQRRVPHEANHGEFLKEVTQIATAGQMTIKDFQPGKPDAKTGYSEMQVTLRGQGSFNSICMFLDRLTKLTRLSKIKDLTLSATDDGSQYPMTATLVIYFGLRGKDAAAIQEGRSG